MTRCWFALALVSSLLSGCASYSRAPLRPASDILAAPDPAILSADAAKVDRPYLTPQPIDLGQPLTPNALAVIAVLENPDLKAQRAKAGVTNAQAFAARLLPDPSFQGNFDKILSGPDVYNAFGAQLGFDLNAIRTAKVTRESGEAAKRQVRLDIAWAEWQTAGQARLLGVRVLALTQQLAIARETAASAELLFAAAERAAGRGDIAAAELDTRRQALLDASDKARTADRDLAAARGELDKTLGLPPDFELRLAGAAASPVPPDSATLVAQAIDRRLDLQALRAGYGVAEADLHKAVLEQFPNLSLTIAGARDTANNYTLGPAIGFSLPLWNRNRGNIAIATATREQLKAEYEARLFQTRAEIDSAVKAVAALRRQRAELAGQMPALQRYADATARAAKRGDLSPATAATAEQSVRDRRLALLQIDQQIAEQTIALELLSGGPSEGWTK
ncbi:MAG: TolC family protein [Proteobacteria bacterium]|nr:TolC family protein [Pseudomonadota bacterium]